VTPSAISAALSALGEIRRERSSAISAFRLRLRREFVVTPSAISAVPLRRPGDPS